jgi:hypothetical protein
MLSAIGQRGSVSEFQSGHFASLAPRSIAGNELGELRISVKRVWVAIIVNLRHAPGRQVIDRLLKKRKCLVSL